MARSYIVALLLALLATPTLAAEQPALKSIDQQLKGLRAQLDRSLWPTDLDATWASIEDSRRTAKGCAETATKEADLLVKDMAALGEPKPGEAASLKEVRKILNGAKAQRDALRARCRSLELAAAQLQETLATQRDKALSDRLTRRYVNVPQMLEGNVRLRDLDPLPVLRSVELKRLGWSPNPWTHLIILLVLTALLAKPAAWALGRWLPRLQVSEQSGFVERALASLHSGLRAHGFWLALWLIWLAYWGINAWRAETWLPMFWLTLLLLAHQIFRFGVDVILRPYPPAVQVTPFERRAARRFGRMLKLGAFIPLALAFVYLVPRNAPLTDAMVAIVRLGALTALLLVLLGLTRSYFRLLQRTRIALSRAIVWTVFLATWVCELLGYRGLSQFLLIGTLGTLALFALGWFLSSVWTDGLDALDEGRHPWQRHLRQRLELDDDQGVPGLVWLRIVGSLVIWAGVGWLLMLAWGASAAQRSRIVGYVTDGFKVGQVDIVPVRIAMALLMFALLAAFAGWFKRQLEQRWLGRARMDPGAKNALVTMSGYIGVGTGLIIALSLAGVDFTSLALIAGALSVGIGFGLQNIVNNFVSGLILLFERPIRKGDWIVVGNTEGYVEKISIRSTVVRTFDRSEVIVPNSELIQNQVTNWMLSDKRGRVRAPVGVAYGSDVELVKKLLTEIGENHPARIKTGVPAPKVLFLGFGESSLNFELRFLIRDVDQRLSVTSDVNFKIDQAFREHGIEIPFPQRVVHMAANDESGGDPNRS